MKENRFSKAALNPLTYTRQVSLLLCILFSNFTASAQEPVYYHYDTHNGLPSSEIYDIIQDDYGYLWFSSDFGLSRYDGYSFQNFTTKDGLTNNIVFNFFKHPNGDIWCSTIDKSVFKIQGKYPKFTPYKWNATLQSLMPHFVLKQICFTDDNTTYFTLINSSGYIAIDSNGESTNRITSVNPNFTHNVANFNQWGQGVVFLGTETYPKIKGFTKHVSKTITEKNRIQTRNAALNFKEQEKVVFLNSQSIKIEGKKTSIQVDFTHEPIIMGKFGENQFWVSFLNGGVSIFDLNGKLVHSFLPNKSVSNLTLDREGGIWISTLQNGVYHVINQEVRNSTTPYGTTPVFSIENDGDKVWVSYTNGALAKYQNGNFTPVYKNEGKRPIHLYFDNKTSTFTHFYNNHLISERLKNPPRWGYIKTLYSEKWKDSYYYYSSSNTTLDRLDEEGNLKSYSGLSTVNSILRFKDTLYLGSHNGLNYFNQESVTAYNSKIKPFNTRINSLTEFNDQLLLGTRGDGLILVNGRTSYEKIGTQEGLSSNFISKIYVQNNKTIWVCTNVGVNRIQFTSKNTYSIDQMTTKEGLKNNEVNSFTIFHDTCWVGTQEGLCFFTTSVFDKKQQQYDYHLRIKEIRINDSKYSKPATELSYKQDRLEFLFAGISFNEARKLQYRYKLKGVDKGWTYTNNRNALYPQLSPGSYTFTVQLKGENDTWEAQESTFAFTIDPPFWKTWWFIGLCISALVSLIYLFFRFQILLFNGTLVREILRVFLKKIKRKSAYIVVNEGPKKVKIMSNTIKYVEADGNYIKIHHDKGKTLTRKKISEFLTHIPDPLEYVQIRRSYIVRIDRVEQKGKKSIIIDGEKINVGSTFLSELEKIQF